MSSPEADLEFSGNFQERSCPTGMEGKVSLDPSFLSGETWGAANDVSGEAGLGLALLTTKSIYSPWRPAQRFWNVFQVLDPAGIFPVRVREPGVVTRLKFEADQLLSARPASLDEWGEKLKAAAALGLCRVAHRAAADLGEADLDLTRETLVALLGRSGNDIARAWAGGGGVEPTSAWLRPVIELAGECWLASIVADENRLIAGVR